MVDSYTTTTTMSDTPSVTPDEMHYLSDKWTLWAHLPHDTNWALDSYIKIFTFGTAEETIAVTETLPSVLVENCMLFLMRDGIKPMWEDPRNKNGGCFSYKITNKNVYKVWKELSYVVVGGSISKQQNYVKNVTGVTISPKKNFCIIKIWLSDCTNQNPEVVTSDLKGLSSHGCLFKKHTPEY